MKSTAAAWFFVMFIIIMFIFTLDYFVFDEGLLFATESEQPAAPTSVQTATEAGTKTDIETKEGDTKTAAEEDVSFPLIGGEYDITVSVTGGATYDTKIQVNYLSKNRIEITGKYGKVPIVVVGTPQGSISSSGGTWGFSPYIPVLFDGTAQATFTRQGEAYALTGSGSGTYFKGLTSGEGSGTGAGGQISKTIPTGGEPYLQSLDNAVGPAAARKNFPAPSPVTTAAAGVAAMAGAMASGSSGRGARKRLKARAESPNIKTEAPPEPEPASSYSPDNEEGM